MTGRRLAWLLLACVLVGCTNQDYYRHVQQERALACRSEPTPDLRQRCLDEAARTFDEYERELRTLDEDRPVP